MTVDIGMLKGLPIRDLWLIYLIYKTKSLSYSDVGDNKMRDNFDLAARDVLDYYFSRIDEIVLTKCRTFD